MSTKPRDKTKSETIRVRMYPHVKLAVVDLGWGMGAEWAWYCTEGVAQAYRLAGHDAYGGKRYPTPYTDLKRAVDGMWLVKWAMTDGRSRR